MYSARPTHADSVLTSGVSGSATKTFVGRNFTFFAGNATADVAVDAPGPHLRAPHCPSATGEAVAS